MSDKITYTAEDIRLYLEGKMSPAQMHALEKAALSDPFLADALEGMELHGNIENFNAEVEELRAKLAGKTKNRRGTLASFSSLWWKVAAILFIVITGIAVIIITVEKNNPVTTEYAKTENKRETKTPFRDSVKKEDVLPVQVSIDTPPKADSRNEKRAAPEPEKAETAVDENISGKKPSVLASSVKDSIADVASVTREIHDDKNRRAEAPSALEGRAAGIAVENAEIADSAYDEVVVVGYGNTKKNKNNRRISAERAEKRIIPQNGWEEFEQYIKDSTKITTADSVFTGEERLSFTIGDDGLPESIKILRSVSPSHDRETIRLLQNGPAWKVTKGKSREIRLKIIF